MRNSIPASPVVRRLARSLALVLALATLLVHAGSVRAEIEAVKGKRYKLTSKHGPWMIMVTSLWGETPEQAKQAEEAADELIYQLRKKGIPAYMYRSEDKYDETHSMDHQRRHVKGKYLAQRGEIGVIAGNYDSIEDWRAQKTLKFVKQFEPKVMAVGANKKPTEVVLPLNKAFLTRNPMLPPETLSKLRDPLLIQLNPRHQNSLLGNKGRYSLIVSTFDGNAQIRPAGFNKFDQRQQSHANISLENAARESELLCATMRKQGYDAYVFHDRYRSVVTVGAFKSESDPEIDRLTKLYQAKYKKNEQTGQEVLVAEAIKIPGRTQNDHLKAWTMDFKPTLIEVPK